MFEEVRLIAMQKKYFNSDFPVILNFLGEPPLMRRGRTQVHENGLIQ
jgi:hypothetical protein